jgi:signal transduction histidine kinase
MTIQTSASPATTDRASRSPAAIPAQRIPDYDTPAILPRVLEAANIAMWEMSRGSLELLSFTAARRAAVLGLSAAQIAPGTAWDTNIYPADRARLRSHLQQRAGDDRPVDYRLIVGEGELLWVRHWTLGRIGARGERARVRCMLMPIPEQKHLEWECLRVSERECNRIGQELHDDVCQVLAGLVFMMRVIGQHAHRLDAALAAEVEDLGNQVSAATDRVRSMAHGLFPAQLKHATLSEALTALAEEAQTLFRLVVTVRLPTALPRHRPEQIIQVYRIAQEAISNAFHHGHATAVKITATRQRERLQLRIEDNGDGFPAAAVRPEGIGVHVMQYRAHALGGTFELRPLPDRGVVALLDYPLSTLPSTQPDATP